MIQAFYALIQGCGVLERPERRHCGTSAGNWGWGGGEGKRWREEEEESEVYVFGCFVW